MNDLDIYWEFLTDNCIATEDELQLVTDINGYSEETLDDILFARTGNRSIEQYCDENGVDNPFAEDDDEDWDEDEDEELDESKSDCSKKFIAQFREVYPEKEVQIVSCECFGDKAIIDAEFPDGEFWFVVSKNTVSRSYNSNSAVLKALGND